MRILVAGLLAVIVGGVVAVVRYELTDRWSAPIASSDVEVPPEGAAARLGGRDGEERSDARPRALLPELDWNAVLANVGFVAYASDRYTSGVPFELAISGSRRNVHAAIAVGFSEVPRVGVDYSAASPEVTRIEVGAWKLLSQGSETEPAEWTSYNAVSEMKVRFRSLPRRSDEEGSLWTPHGKMTLTLVQDGAPDLPLVVDF
jgi:hypothetical protein